MALKFHTNSMFCKIALTVVIIIAGFFINSCSSSGNNTVDKESGSIKKEVPPPVNSADVNAEIISIVTEGNYTISDIKILKVNSYGSSVPPLPVGTIIKAEVTKSSVENSKISEQELLKSGAKRNIILQHFAVPSNLKSDYWRIISIK